MDKLERMQKAFGALMELAVSFRQKVIDVSGKDAGTVRMASFMKSEAEWNAEEIGPRLFELGDALEQLGEEQFELAVLVGEGDIEGEMSS